jgi:cytoskeletal protein CcmA (bactofilin family)
MTDSQQVQKKLFNTIKSIKSITSVLSKDMSMEGKINSGSSVEIEGKFKGDINGKRVCIRGGAEVEGLILAQFLSIEGKFNGEIKSNSINIAKTANITSSNIEYITLSVEDGASIDGNFKKIDQTKKK